MSGGIRRSAVPDRATRGVAIVGVVHLLPLPGAPEWGGSMDTVGERAHRDVAHLTEAGVDGVLLENFLDQPFFPTRVPPETVAAMAILVRDAIAGTDVAVGINVLRNDPLSALGIAAATGAAFLRVNVHVGTMFTDQGPIGGRAHETLRRRRELDLRCAVLADVLVKHAVPPVGLTAELAAKDCWHRGLADGLIVTGSETGAPVDPDTIARVRRATPEAPLWIGSGVTAANAKQLAPLVDGVLVGSALQHEGRAGAGVDPGRARAVVDALRDAPDSAARKAV